MVCDKDGCESWCVTMLRVKKIEKSHVKGKTEDVVRRERGHRQRRWCRMEQLELYVKVVRERSVCAVHEQARAPCKQQLFHSQRSQRETDHAGACWCDQDW